MGKFLLMGGREMLLQGDSMCTLGGGQYAWAQFPFYHLPDAGLWVSCFLSLDAIIYAVVTEMPPSPTGAGFKVRLCLQVITKVQANSCSANVKYQSLSGICWFKNKSFKCLVFHSKTGCWAVLFCFHWACGKTRLMGFCRESTKDLYVHTFFILTMLLWDGFLTPQGKLRHTALLKFAQVILLKVFLCFHLSLKWSWRKIFFSFNFYFGERYYGSPYCPPFYLDLGQGGYFM